MSLQEGIFALLILVAALLYSSVGHGGASGYLAVMALMGVAPVEMRPVALSLNILVAVIATFKYYRAGAFSWRLFWPLAIASIPCAYIGGTLTLSGHLYKPVLGVVLIYSAWHIFRTLREPELPVVERPALWVLLSVGSVLGFLSGLTGVGGGIFLSPLILYYRWAKVKTVSGIAAAFIFVNSIAALTGVAKLAPTLPSALPYWAVAAVMGGLIGAEYGSKRLGNPVIKKLLSLVLLIAGMKMIAV
jgi:hypothetical protein